MFEMECEFMAQIVEIARAGLFEVQVQIGVSIVNRYASEPLIEAISHTEFETGSVDLLLIFRMIGPFGIFGYIDPINDIPSPTVVPVCRNRQRAPVGEFPFAFVAEG